MSVSLAHSRIEVLDKAGLPTVEIWIDPDKRYSAWSEFVEERRKGISMQRSQARSIGRLIDFIAAKGVQYRPESERRKLFTDFADALQFGTVRDGDDPADLFWLPSTRSAAARIIRDVTEFIDWLVDELKIKPINPAKGATLSEEIAFWRAWYRRKNASLLAHLKGRAPPSTKASAFHAVARVRGQKIRHSETAYHFPDDLLQDLLVKGFSRNVRRRWTTYRDVCITLLLAGGSIRISEALHLWIIDVFEDPGDPSSAIVKVYHPSDGVLQTVDPATQRPSRISRAQFLRLRYGTVPLTDRPGNRAVGWKGSVLDEKSDNCFQVVWRDPVFGRLFRQAFDAYMINRPLARGHPFLFITDSPARNPMTVKAFEKVHAAAMRRIGTVSSKSRGTTPHGHRHASGKDLAVSGLSEKVIQKIFHHASIESQSVYKQPSISDIQDALRNHQQVFWGNLRSSSRKF